MANIKISELNPLVTIQDADVLPIVDNAITKKVTAAILRSYTEGNSVLLTGAQTVAGIKTFTSQLASSVATGTAPFSVASTTKVTNLNADLLDGLSSADFALSTRTLTAGTGLTGGGDLTANRTFAIDSTVATLTGTQTLTNKTITSPVINEILDSNGNEILGFTPIASATDYITIKNGIGVGVPLHISAAGSSTNTGIHLEPKGTGLVQISDGTDTTKGIRFRSSASATGAITLIDAVSSAGHVITLPNATTTLVGTNTTDTLTNKSISGATNTLSNIGNASLTNSAITINGTSTSLGGSINVGTVTSVAALTLGTSGTDLTSSVATGTTTPVITLNVPTASASNRGALSSTDWSTFNAKQNAITLTTTGTSGAATLVGATLNIPQYQSVLTNPITGTGTTNYLPKFTGASTLGDSNLISNSVGNLGLGVVPSTSASIKTIQFGAGAGLFTNNTNNTGLFHNATLDASANFLYAVTGQQSSYYTQINGVHRWYYAAAGTAGNAITFTQNMSLDVLGQLSTVGDATINGVKVGEGGGSIATNTAVGASALNANTTGDYNTALGSSALVSNISGANNTALGASALFGNVTGSANTAIGLNALRTNTASNNTAVGFEAAYTNASGTNITAIGYRALKASTGANNTALGGTALTANTTGTSNTAIGFQSLLSNTTGIENTAIGVNSLVFNVIGSYNTAIGRSSLQANTASNNTAVGFEAAKANTTGTGITAIGHLSLTANTTGNDNTAMGVGALGAVTTVNNNTAIGRSALAANTAANNTALGFEAAKVNTTGTGITAIGYQALVANTGSQNTALGFLALNGNIGGNSNTAIGSQTVSGSFDASVIIGRAATATASNQFVVGSASYPAGAVATEVNASSKVWNVIINGVAQKILLA